MQHDITKLCADSLRSFLDTNYSIKLKSGHAHEIVAAFFGYKSRISMLADIKYPIGDMARAEFIVLRPDTPFVDQRLKGLEGLPPDLPPSQVLAEGVYSVITGDKELLGKIQPGFHDLALILAEENLRSEVWRLDFGTMDWDKDVTIQESEGGVSMKVSLNYPTDTGEKHRYRKYDIRLPRIAANLGYGEPRIIPTQYTGNAGKYSDEEWSQMFPAHLQSFEA